MLVPDSFDNTPAAVEVRMEQEQRRRAHLKAVTVFGAIGIFGISDFVAALLRDAVTSTRIVSCVAAVASGIAALILWRDGVSARVPNEELKPTAAPSSLVK